MAHETRAEQSIDMELAAAAAAQVLRAQRDSARSMGLTDPIDELITTAGARNILIRALQRHAELFIVALFEKHRTNLALARFQLLEVERSLVLARAAAAQRRARPRRQAALPARSASALLASASAFSLQRSPLWPLTQRTRDPARIGEREQLLPQRQVGDRLALGVAPALAFPAGAPLGQALEHVLAVGDELRPRRPRARGPALRSPPSARRSGWCPGR